MYLSGNRSGARVGLIMVGNGHQYTHLYVNGDILQHTMTLHLLVATTFLCLGLVLTEAAHVYIRYKKTYSNRTKEATITLPRI